MRRKSPRGNGPSSAKPVFTSPFKGLEKLLEQQVAARPAPKPQTPKTSRAQAEPAGGTGSLKAPAEAVPDDGQMLREAFQGVRPILSGGPHRMPVEPQINRNVISEDAEVLAQLSDLVSGVSHFDITETDEYVEGSRNGIDPRLLIRLRRGDFATQAHIDLHGMTQAEARHALAGFIEESIRKGLRAVLVVHGRGLRSPGGWPVLKRASAQWLSHGAISGHVLAFATARASDGGAGALYVLLKHVRRRGSFEVLNGAKRHD